MTYGVPYSFVPGTKAKADEVNANFIDVLNKIEDTNTRIDNESSQTEENLQSLETELSEQISALETVSANKDLSNLSSAGQGKFDAKANTSIVDGTWVNKHTALCSDKTISPGNTHTYSLSSYLPNDGNKYKILIGSFFNLASTSSLAFVYIKSDFHSNTMPIFRMGASNSNSKYGGVLNEIVVSTGRSVTVSMTTASANNTNYGVSVYAYRKVR